jgi:hypothetical protein
MNTGNVRRNPVQACQYLFSAHMNDKEAKTFEFTIVNGETQ